MRRGNPSYLPNIKSNTTAWIAMSGGVDSSVAAYLTRECGFDCAAVTMRLFNDDDRESVEDARHVADMLGIPFHIEDYTCEFQQQVIIKFITAYQSGATPNPCIECNRFIKFGALLDTAKANGIDYLVTGHYARVEHNEATGRYLLKKAYDDTKDQSYFLYTLTQEQLAHIIFPLGELQKDEIREIAARENLINAMKRESQDICFIRNGDYAEFIESYIPVIAAAQNVRVTRNPLTISSTPGDFIDLDGNILGKHKGLIHYTIGQRRGLGLSLPAPLYVHSKNVADNTVILCEEKHLFNHSLTATNFNWIAQDAPDSPLRVKAKIRYAKSEQPATATPKPDGTIAVVFDEPQRAIAKGQAVVFYDDDVVIGGGTIA